MMLGSLFRFVLALSLGALFLLTTPACGDDDGETVVDDAGPDGGDEPESDAGMDGGGDDERDSSTPPPRTDSSTTTPDAGDPYQCVPPEPPAGGDVGAGGSCCDGLGTCQTAESGAQGVGDCDTSQDLRCVANEMQASLDAGADDDGGAGSLLASCTFEVGEEGYEGRCVPECLAAGTSASLRQGDCMSGELCVPCYSPITGEDTGACRSTGDAPADPAPPGFADCGDGNTGYCVPAMAAGSVNLPQLTCAEGEVCAPKNSVTTPGYCFEHCTAFGPGACVPSFVIDEASRGLLPQDVCAEGELCAPCVNPTNGERTGACD